MLVYSIILWPSEPVFSGGGGGGKEAAIKEDYAPGINGPFH